MQSSESVRVQSFGPIASTPRSGGIRDNVFQQLAESEGYRLEGAWEFSGIRRFHNPDTGGWRACPGWGESRHWSLPAPVSPPNFVGKGCHETSRFPAAIPSPGPGALMRAPACPGLRGQSRNGSFSARRRRASAVAAPVPEGGPFRPRATGIATKAAEIARNAHSYSFQDHAGDEYSSR